MIAQSGSCMSRTNPTISVLDALKLLTAPGDSYRKNCMPDIMAIEFQSRATVNLRPESHCKPAIHLCSMNLDSKRFKEERNDVPTIKALGPRFQTSAAHEQLSIDRRSSQLLFPNSIYTGLRHCSVHQLASGTKPAFSASL